jgi:CBS domain-containing protein
MFVKDRRQEEVITVKDEGPVPDIVHLMKENNIPQLSAVRAGRPVGINIISPAIFSLENKVRRLRDKVYRVASDAPAQIALAVEALKETHFGVGSVLRSEQPMIM